MRRSHAVRRAMTRIVDLGLCRRLCTDGVSSLRHPNSLKIAPRDPVLRVIERDL
jgi:hypothetical protein